MALTVYIETTIPSAYVSSRTDPGSLHRRHETREWWIKQLPFYEGSTSDNVLLELQNGVWPNQAEAIALIESLPRIEINLEVIETAQRFINEKLVPASLAGDATHLAAACVHAIDFLVTWNIRHLANPRKVEHLSTITGKMGLHLPIIVTPEALWVE